MTLTELAEQIRSYIDKRAERDGFAMISIARLDLWAAQIEALAQDQGEEHEGFARLRAAQEGTL